MPAPLESGSLFIFCLLFSTLESDKAVESVLASKGREKTELISKMLEDEKYQREAFQALLLQQDDRALEIGEQMARIQNELASLTFVEMKKRDMKVSSNKTLLKRTILLSFSSNVLDIAAIAIVKIVWRFTFCAKWKSLVLNKIVQYFQHIDMTFCFRSSLKWNLCQKNGKL